VRDRHVGIIVALVIGTAVALDAQVYTPARTPDGQPSIQGVWQPVPGGSYSIEDLDLQAIYQQGKSDPNRKGKSRIVDPANGRIPYQPWAAAQAKIYFDAHLDPPRADLLDPVARCAVQSVPRAMYQGEFEVFQPAGYVVFLFARAHQYRIVPLDGRPPLGKDIQLYMGDSRARWEGTTLVINTTNFNNKTWFDIVGGFHSDAMRVEERLTLVSADSIDYRVTIDDPKVYTRPWTMAVSMRPIKEEGYEIIEEACHEGERSADEILNRPGR
jgi:hypothetical protein